MDSQVYSQVHESFQNSYFNANVCTAQGSLENLKKTKKNFK